jgi:hypothetical protein
VYPRRDQITEEKHIIVSRMPFVLPPTLPPSDVGVLKLTFEIVVFDNIPGIHHTSDRVVGGDTLPSLDRGMKENVIAWLKGLELLTPPADIAVGKLFE